MIIDLPKCINGSLALYADDSFFWQVGTDIDEINQKMQNNLFNVQTWCHNWNFKISVSKSVTMLFTKESKLSNIKLKIEEGNISSKANLIIWEFIFRQIAHTINILNTYRIVDPSARTFCAMPKVQAVVYQKNQCCPYTEQ